MVFPLTRMKTDILYAWLGLLTLSTLFSPFPLEAAPNAKATTSAKSSQAMLAPATKDSPLDTATVRRYYLDGDFDPAIDLLETALLYKSGFTHQDSIFIFKHLGVMYAAKYETREKGKKNMLRLLEVEPTARIMDMYASDMIYMIFKNIQDEFDAERRRLGKANTVPSLEKGSTEQSQTGIVESPKKGISAAIWLSAGATVAAAAGAATWYYFSDTPKTRNVDLE